MHIGDPLRLVLCVFVCNIVHFNSLVTLFFCRFDFVLKKNSFLFRLFLHLYIYIYYSVPKQSATTSKITYIPFFYLFNSHSLSYFIIRVCYSRHLIPVGYMTSLFFFFFSSCQNASCYIFLNVAITFRSFEEPNTNFICKIENSVNLKRYRIPNVCKYFFKYKSTQAISMAQLYIHASFT